jgi:integrase
LNELRELDKLIDTRKRNPAAKRQIPGTLGWLFIEFKKSPAWTNNLGERSRRDYEKIFTWLEPIDDKPLREMTPKRSLALIEEAFKQKKRSFANRTLELLKLVFNWAIPREHVKINPFEKVKKFARPKDLPEANRAWSHAEQRIVLAQAQGPLRVTLGLCMFGCFRVGLAVIAPWDIYDGAWFKFRFKTEDWHTLRVHGVLKKILDETPRTGPTMVAKRNGQTYTESGLEWAFRQLRQRLEREGKIQPGLTFHGLRHTAGNVLADLGADPKTIAAMLGQVSEAAAGHYSRGADRRRKGEKAVEMLEQVWNRHGNVA